MNKLIVLTILSIITLVAFLVAGKVNYSEGGSYLDQQVLDTASPLNVSIDVEFLQKLTPAYE